MAEPGPARTTKDASGRSGVVESSEAVDRALRSPVPLCDRAGQDSPPAVAPDDRPRAATPLLVRGARRDRLCRLGSRLDDLCGRCAGEETDHSREVIGFLGCPIAEAGAAAGTSS